MNPALGEAYDEWWVGAEASGSRSSSVKQLSKKGSMGSLSWIWYESCSQGEEEGSVRWKCCCCGDGAAAVIEMDAWSVSSCRVATSVCAAARRSCSAAISAVAAALPSLRPCSSACLNKTRDANSAQILDCVELNRDKRMICVYMCTWVNRCSILLYMGECQCSTSSIVCPCLPM